MATIRDREAYAVVHPGGHEMLKGIREASPCFKARVAGGIFLLVILGAAFTQFFVRGRLGFAADLSVGLIEVSGMIAVTLLFYDIFRAVNRSLTHPVLRSRQVGFRSGPLRRPHRGLGHDRCDAALL